ncbi:MAG: hypothetical protein DMG54_18185 [Acidobacteria bacterium]|nr:MAG: hypothetical protein DMG54_18185 [Acidobacteriota bacterium]PYU46208.1 MAG: hypothetical protein DMG53_12510 [Acidobacteriota bacterium]PYU70657.1 MAG: hypothetical protein DMG52_24980 [Acidobacteriota bacterium]
MPKQTLKFPPDMSVAEFTTFAAAILAEVLLVIAFFSDDIFRFFTRRPVFEVLVLALLLEILWILRRKPLQIGLVLNDREFQAEIARLIQTEHIDHVRILGAGMSSLKTPIQEFCQAGIKVKVLCQHPDTAVDIRDGQRARESIELIYHLKDKTFVDYLEGKFGRDAATVRGVLLTPRESQMEYLFVGWYTYAGEPPKIAGRRNPMIMVTSTTERGRILIRFFSDLFEARWSRPDAEPWPPPPK